MRARRSLGLSLLIVAVLAGPGAAGAGEPTDQLKASIDALYRAVSSAPAQTPPAEVPGARAIVDRMFDWTAMAEASLRGHWQRRTAAERAEFSRLFSDLFARAYVSRINLVDARAFQYLGDTTTGDRGRVRTKVVTKRGSTLDVDYVVRATAPQHWQVQDVRVESISLIDNYRAQFDSIIGRSSYENLVARLRAAGRG